MGARARRAGRGGGGKEGGHPPHLCIIVFTLCGNTFSIIVDDFFRLPPAAALPAFPLLPPAPCVQNCLMKKPLSRTPHGITVGRATDVAPPTSTRRESTAGCAESAAAVEDDLDTAARAVGQA